MHPAPSIIVFTVLSGLGLGMMTWVGLGLGPDDTGFGWLASVLVMVVSGVGGLASTGHLARPDRAWRAFSQWRSSWLSREACLMIVAMAVYGVYALIWLFGGERIDWLGWIAAALALATVYSTAMIYAQLKTVPRWRHTPTTWLFLALSISGGYMAIAGAVAAYGAAPDLPDIGPVIVAIGGVVGVIWHLNAASTGREAGGATIGTATGLGRLGAVRLFEAPHSGSNYLLSEMAYQIGRKQARSLRIVAALCGVILPLALGVLAAATSDLVLIAAVLAHLVGALAHRWLFFAEAEHVQALYYGRT